MPTAPEEVQRRKELFLLEYENRDVVTEVCDFLKIDRSLPYKWSEVDPLFKTRFDELKEQKKSELRDIAKKSLKVRLHEKDPYMIRFVLNCLDPDFREQKKIQEESTQTQTIIRYEIIRGNESENQPIATSCVNNNPDPGLPPPLHATSGTPGQ